MMEIKTMANGTLKNGAAVIVDAKTLAAIQNKAFNAAEGESALTSAVLLALGTTPTKEALAPVRQVVIGGTMASRMAQRGDNRKSGDLFKHCELLITKYQGATGTAPVRDGMLGRRTEEQEADYTHGRKVFERVLKAADITNPDARGKASAEERKAKAAAAAKEAEEAKAKEEKEAKAKARAEQGKLAVRTYAKPEPYVEALAVTVKAMLGTHNNTVRKTKEAATLSPIGDAIALLLEAVNSTAKSVGVEL